MGELKLSVIEAQMKEQRERSRLQEKKYGNAIGNCSCPCWAFLHEGEFVDYGDDDVASAGSWNID